MEISGKMGSVKVKAGLGRGRKKGKGERDRTKIHGPRSQIAQKAKKEKRKEEKEVLRISDCTTMAMEVDLQEVQSVPKVQEYMLLPMF